MTTSPREVLLPVIGKRVLRLGLAGNYGIDSQEMRAAADLGVNYWVWTPNYRKVTPVLNELFKTERERHVVSMLGVAYWPGMVRSGVEKALRKLGTDYLDCYQLSWLGRMSFFTQGLQDILLQLKQEGKIRSCGVSIHDRPRAGQLARDSILDLFMIRYNAAHPGAEQDIFPHLAVREPAVVAYTATSWRQLLKPLGIEMPPWPGASETPMPPPLSAALAYRFCLASPHVHVVLTGPASLDQLKQNLAVLDMPPLSAEEDAWIRAYGRQVRSRKKIPFL